MLRVPGAENLLRGSLLHISESKTLAQWLTHNAAGHKLASRFVAGETLDSAVDAVRQLNSRGLVATLDHLGEAVKDPNAATLAATDYLAILDRLHETGIGSNVSLKLTQMGLDIEHDLCISNVLRVLDKAREMDQFVRFDMESSTHTQRTLDIFQEVWGLGYRNCGIVLQAYLQRTEGDIEMAIAMEARVRLCKGAYAEPPAVAFASKADTDENYLKLARALLDRGKYPALATHDERIINQIKSWSPNPTSFEFQMLYGVRPELQQRLVNDGYRVRAYVPFGIDWYAYFMRRLAERPANLTFFISTLLREPVQRAASSQNDGQGESRE